MGICLRLLVKEKWNYQILAGSVGRFVFASAFRRCLLSLIEELFVGRQTMRGEKKPTSKALDEVFTMATLMPLTFTNVRAPIYQKLSATDASPTGAGSCEAASLKRPKGIPNPNNFLCAHCRSDVSEQIAGGEDIECPFACGARVCSLQCFLDHRDTCSEAAAEGAAVQREMVRAKCSLEHCLPTRRHGCDAPLRQRSERIHGLLDRAGQRYLGGSGPNGDRSGASRS